LIVRLFFEVFWFDTMLTLSVFFSSLSSAAESKFMVSGAADNTLRLWSVQTGKNLFTWEFPTAVKRVAFNDDGTRVVCITEQRMGYQCAIRTFKINRDGDGTNRESFRSLSKCGPCKSLPDVFRVEGTVV
jgi:WD40 repeat protein